MTEAERPEEGMPEPDGEESVQDQAQDQDLGAPEPVEAASTEKDQAFDQDALDADTEEAGVEAEKMGESTQEPLPQGETEQAESVFDEPVQAEAPEEPLPVSRLQRWLSPILRWTAVFAVVFGLGVLATILLRVRPQNQAIEAMQAEHAAAVAEMESTIDDQEAQIEDLTETTQDQADELQSLTEQVEGLEGQLEETQQHLLVLQLLTDVTRAQVAMTEQDVTTAQAALAGTKSKLDALASGLTEAEQETLENMSTRLDIILSELDDDPETALIDLGLLVNSLTALQGSLFGE